jgi:hypothetical protein
VPIELEILLAWYKHGQVHRSYLWFEHTGVFLWSTLQCLHPNSKWLDMHVGANTVKCTNPNPYLVLSESDSILCTNTEFCKEKHHRHFLNKLIYKDKQFMMTFKIPRKFHIF